jgi:glycosyltransferase involved in cell wall biosynthesis
MDAASQLLLRPGQGPDRPLVGVTIPMYNASQTIDSTVASVCAQTYRNLDIVIVDDGSTDDSAQKVRGWAEREPRLRLLRQENSGVAAARNLGAANTNADYLAFIDADDLWAPAKIEVQLDALIKSGEEVGLVYSWYAHIDDTDRVLSLSHRPEAEGWVLRDLLQTNVVGNGSSALFRRAAFESAGGFDPALRDNDAQGSEDLAIYLRAAELCEFRVIKRHLVGYRILANNMSSDPMRMVRSCSLVLSEYRQRHAEFSHEMDRHLDDLRFWLLVRAASSGRYRPCYDLATQIWRSNPHLLIQRLPEFIQVVCRAKAPRFLKKLMQALHPRSPGLRSRYLDESW